MSESERRPHPEKSQRAVPADSPLAAALLGLVIERPGHGYELAQRFEEAYGDALPLTDHRNIYRLLRALQTQSLIREVRPSADEKPPPNRVQKLRFRATARGVREYQQWLVSEMEEQRNRQRLFALQLSMLEPGAALSVIQRYETECLEGAAEPAQPEQIAPKAKGPVGVARRLADADERLALEVRLTWIAYARSELQALIKERGGRDE